MLKDNIASNLKMHSNSDLLNSDTTSFDNYNNELFRKSEYVDPGCRTVFNATKLNDLAIIHFNIRSLQKHIDEISNYLAGLENKIVAFSDTKLQERKINQSIDLEGYNSIHKDSITSAG